MHENHQSLIMGSDSLETTPRFSLHDMEFNTMDSVNSNYFWWAKKPPLSILACVRCSAAGAVEAHKQLPIQQPWFFFYHVVHAAHVARLQKPGPHIGRDLCIVWHEKQHVGQTKQIVDVI